MNQLPQSLEREGGGRLAFLSSRLASLARPSVAVWAPIPLRLIVGSVSWSMASRNCREGQKSSPSSCMRWAYPRPISWHGSRFDRTHRRPRRPARSFCPSCKYADGRGSFRSDANCSSPLRVQLDQAAERDVWPRTGCGRSNNGVRG